MPLFTSANAAILGHKGAEARWKPKFDPAIIPPTVEHGPDFLADDLAQACKETLLELRKARKPMERAQLARALRDLRETWHLATGKPRPGLAKEQSGRMARREMPRVTPTVPGETVDQVVYGQNPPEAKPS